MKELQDLPPITELVNDSVVVIIDKSDVVNTMPLSLFKGSGIRTGEVGYTLYTIKIDDDKFIDGDYISVDERGSVFLFGPYVRGEGFPLAAAPLIGPLRGPITHTMTSDSFGNDDIPNDDAVQHTLKPITGDLMVVSYQISGVDTGKQLTYKAKVNYSNHVVDWGVGVNTKGVTVHTVDSPEVNDKVFSVGDYAILNGSLLLGPYDTGLALWPVHNEFRTRHEYVAFASDWGVDDIPNTDATTFISPMIITGDTLTVKYRISATLTGKELLYSATVDYPTNVITWAALGNPSMVQTHNLVDDQLNNLIFSNGDWGILPNGNRMGPYDDTLTSWPVHNIIVGSDMGIADDNNGESYTIKATGGLLYLEDGSGAKTFVGGSAAPSFESGHFEANTGGYYLIDGTASAVIVTVPDDVDVFTFRDSYLGTRSGVDPYTFSEVGTWATEGRVSLSFSTDTVNMPVSGVNANGTVWTVVRDGVVFKVYGTDGSYLEASI